MRHVSGGNMLAGRLAVLGLVIEKDIGAIGMQKFTLIEAAEKERFIDADIPVTQGQYHALVRGR